MRTDHARNSSAAVLCSDNLTLMRALGSGSCDLIYIDPPFDLKGFEVADRVASPRTRASFDQRLNDFLSFLRPRLVQMRRLLSDRGSLYLHLDWRTVHHAKVMLDGLFGADHFLNEIIWSYRSGGRTGRWFARKHDTLLLYAKNPGCHTFNRLRDGKYRTRDLRVASDGRPYKSTKSGPIYFDPAGPIVPDVWDIPILSTVANERMNYPSQKPEALLERIVQSSSDEGDLVADFFCGSGTTLAVANRLKRRYLGCDINPDAVAITKRRLANASDTTDAKKRSKVEDANAQSNDKQIPFAAQWGVTTTTRVWIGGQDLDARREVEDRLVGVVRPATGPIDLAFVTPLTVDEALYFASKLRPRLAPSGAVWIVHSAHAASPQPGPGVTPENLDVTMAAQRWNRTRDLDLDEIYASTRFEPATD